MALDSSINPIFSGRWLARGLLALVVLAHLLLLVGVEKGLTQAGQALPRIVLSVPWLIPSPVATPLPATELPAPKPPVAKQKLPGEVVNKSAKRIVEPAATPTDSTSAQNTSDATASKNVSAADSAANSDQVDVNSSSSAKVNVDAISEAKPIAEPPARADTSSLPSAQPVVSNARLVVAPTMPFEAKFSVYQGDAAAGAVLGKTTLRLQAKPGVANSYQSDFIVNFNWVTRMLADDRTWSSSGQITPVGLVPEQLTETRGKRPPKQTQLNWTALQATSGETQFALIAGAQDRVSAIWQLGSMARSDPDQFVSEAQVQLPLVVSNKLTMSRWRVQHENIMLFDKPTEVLHLTRVDTRDDDLRFEFWLDKQASMQPVKIRLSDPRGRVFELLKESPT
jgi:Protein of unknown function (DUF3108)